MRGGNPVDLLPRRTWRPWWFAWHRRITTGVTGGFGARCPIWDTNAPTARSLISFVDTGIEPAPVRNRKTTWTEFLKRHWELIVSADSFTTEIWTVKGLTRYLVLFFIDLSTRRVEVAGIASRANGLWMSQVGRHVTDAVDGVLKTSAT